MAGGRGKRRLGCRREGTGTRRTKLCCEELVRAGFSEEAPQFFPDNLLTPHLKEKIKTQQTDKGKMR